MTDQDNWDWVLALLVKYGAGVAGSVLSLRFLPPNATGWDRAWAVGGGVASVVWAVPALVELLEVSKPGLIGLMGLVSGCIGMAVLAELSAAVRGIGFGAIAGDWLRKVLGVGRGDRNG